MTERPAVVPTPDDDGFLCFFVDIVSGGTEVKTPEGKFSVLTPPVVWNPCV